jgi:fructose-bisphosphate aldolase class II
MLVTLTEILKLAEEKKIAVGAFNTPNMTSVKAVISAAEEMKAPVILMHAQVHEEMGLCAMEEITPVMIHFAKNAKIPVCVHLDHGTDINYVKKGLALGFTSVMYDGSTLSHRENIANTKTVVEEAKKTGASVEAEIGSMGARESGGAGGASVYTDPEQAKTFVDETKIDALACAFGTAHGIYLQEPILDFERLERIQALTSVPLVMHGGSGVSAEDYKKVIRLGIRKINYYTYMAKAAGAAVAAMQDKTYFHDMEVVAMNAMKENVKEAITIFNQERGMNV